MRCSFAVVVFCAACGNSNKLPDGFFVISTDAASNMPDASGVVNTQDAKYAVSTITLPSSSSEYGWDLDGDGKPDNQFGTIFGQFGSQGVIAPQTYTTAAIENGTDVLLIDEDSTDATQQSAIGTVVKLSLALPTSTPPKLDGTDTFTSSGTPATFTGDIASGAFASADPAKATVPVTTTLDVYFGTQAIAMPLTAARIAFTRNADDTLKSGQLNGAFKMTDIDGTLFPALAALLTQEEDSDMSSASTVKSVFDTNGDGTITVTELEGNSTIQALFAPDVQLFDSSGNYEPNPAKTTPDSISVGVAFTGVAATF